LFGSKQNLRGFEAVGWKEAILFLLMGGRSEKVEFAVFVKEDPRITLPSCNDHMQRLEYERQVLWKQETGGRILEDGQKDAIVFEEARAFARIDFEVFLTDESFRDSSSLIYGNGNEVEGSRSWCSERWVGCADSGGWFDDESGQKRSEHVGIRGSCHFGEQVRGRILIRPGGLFEAG
jgi:hypothetical protein